MTDSATSTTEQQIRTCVASALGVPESEVNAETAFGVLPQWDSMGHMSVVLAVEQAFDVAFESYEIADLTSVAAIRAALGARGRAS